MLLAKLNPTKDTVTYKEKHINSKLMTINKEFE